MLKRLTAIFFLLLATTCFADTVTMPQYQTGDTLTASNLNNRFNILTNLLNASLTNDNVDVDGGYRLIEILTELPAAGNQGRVVFHKTTNTLNFDTGASMLATALLANNQTFTGTNTFSGSVSFSTITDLGAVTTGDINGGTINGLSSFGMATGSDITEIADEDDMSSDSATKLATQQSIKYYVDTTDRVDFYTSSDTWTAPTGVTKVYVTMVAGGGDGGASSGATPGSGGGGGESCINYPYTVTPGNGYTVTVGSGGNNSAFDSLTVVAGADGSTGAAASGGAGGARLAGSTSSFDAYQNSGATGKIPGGNGADSDDGTYGAGGGGGTPFGVGGDASGSGAGNPGTGYGSGGGGSGGATASGGAGQAGFVLIAY